MADNVKLLAGLLTQLVQQNVVDSNGKVLAKAGDMIVILPQTTARAVLVGEQSLEDLWETLSKTGHIHQCFGVCTTDAATVEKVVTVNNFSLVAGAEVTVRFTVTNTANNPTLNVNETGAKAVQYRNAAISKGYLAANRTYRFVYDGTNWQLIGDINTDTNTKVTQTLTTTNAEYALIFMADAAATANKTNSVRFASAVTLNPSTGVITAPGFKGALTGDVTGNVSGSSGSCTGNAATATQLASARKLKVALGSTTDVTFDGSGDQTSIPVSGTLPVARGGTGQTSIANIQAGKDSAGNTITSTYATKTDLENLSKGLVQVVSALPSTGTEGVIYLVPVSGQTNTYTKHTWENNAWVALGSTSVDLSNYATKDNAIKALSVSGKTITYTKADGTTGTITTQDTDTHWTTTLFAGAKDAKSNAVTTNGNTYVKLYDNNTARAQLNIKGSGATSVTSDANGAITISSKDTTYNTATSSANGLMSKEDKANFDNWAEKLSNYQTELIRWTDRTTKLETWAADNGYSLS